MAGSEFINNSSIASSSNRPLLRCGFTSMLQKNSETHNVGNQQQSHNQSWNDICRSQLPRQEPAVTGLVESIEQIGCAPDAKDPGDSNASRPGQQEQLKHCQYRRDEVPIGRLVRKGRGQIRGHYARDQKGQPHKAEAVKHEYGPQGICLWTMPE